MSDPDRVLVRKAQRGDRRALTELYERHKRNLLGFLVKILGSRQTAEDVFQEVWVKVLNGIQGYRESRGSFRSWLFRVGGNAAVDRLRRDAVRSGPELDAEIEAGGERRVDRIASDLPGPEREGEGAEFARHLAAALTELSERQRVAVLLRHQQGMSYQEVATAMNVAEGTAKTLVHRGVSILKERLEAWA